MRIEFRYQNIMLLENGTPRRNDPGCGLMPTKSIFAFFETLYSIIASSWVCWRAASNVGQDTRVFVVPLPPFFCPASFPSRRIQ